MGAPSQRQAFLHCCGGLLHHSTGRPPVRARAGQHSTTHGRRPRPIAGLPPRRQQEPVEAAIRHIHNMVGHRGMHTTWDALHDHYDGIARKFVRAYITRCFVCQTKAPPSVKTKVQPIIIKQMHRHLLIDLIDFQNRPDGPYHYIVHLADHRTRFHWAQAIVNKEAATVAAWLVDIIAIIGGGWILQSDNGGEFAGEVDVLCTRFRIQRDRSSPYHPETNGLIEKGNDSMKKMIHKWQQTHDTNSWADCIPEAVIQLNTSWSRVINTTPYELVYGYKYRTEMVPVIDPALLRQIDRDDYSPSVEDLEMEQPNTAQSLPVSSPPLSPLPTPPPARNNPPPVVNNPPPEEKNPTAPPLSPTSAEEGIGHAVRPGGRGRRITLTASPGDEDLDDLYYGDTGELGRHAQALLNVRGFKFNRYGTIGQGRCSLAALRLALTNCRHDGTKKGLLEHL